MSALRLMIMHRMTATAASL